MELLLLMLLPVALLGAIGTGGGSGSGDTSPGPDDGPEGGRVRVGSTDDESLSGTAGDDLIFAGGGSDVVEGQAGDDLLFGEAQNDRLFGGAGEDILFGGFDADELRGGADDDLLFGGAGRDSLFGEAGDDILIGGSDFDSLNGGAGDDIVSGVEIMPDDVDDSSLAEVTAQITTLVALRHGAAAADRFGARIERAVLSTNAEQADPEAGGLVPRPDLVEGGDGNDTLFGDYGDVLTGGAGRDLFVAVYEPDSEPVTIRDFTADDLISLDMGALTGPIGYTRLDEGLLITVGSAAVAVVEGVFDPTLLAPRVSIGAVNPAV